MLKVSDTAYFNLCIPPSACPRCQHNLTFLDNIPVFSFLWLKGRCRYCLASISWRYPLVELLSMSLSLVILTHYGLSIEMLGALLLTFALITLSFIDFEEGILPDNITLPFLWLGLLFNSFITHNSQDAILGAALGYLSLWLIYHVFKFLSGKEGMGYGDFKLLAMLGAWLGYQTLPLIILLASLMGSLVGLGLIFFLGRDRNKPLPFGPYLAIAGWISLLWGQAIISFYSGIFAL